MVHAQLEYPRSIREVTEKGYKKNVQKKVWMREDFNCYKIQNAFHTSSDAVQTYPTELGGWKVS